MASPKEIPSDKPEAAARYHLDRLLRGDKRAAMRSVVAAEDPRLVPDLQCERTQTVKLPSAAEGKALRGGSQRKAALRLVRFQQTKAGIPVFGSAATVEMDSENRLLSADVNLAHIGQVSPVSKVSDADAMKAIAGFTGAPPDKLAEINGTLTYFSRNEADEWHLAWYYRAVPAAPPGLGMDARRGLGGESPRDTYARFDYLVDAHDGEILFHYRSTPALKLFSPAGAKGYDEDGNLCEFMGRRVEDPRCIEMHDEIARVKTFDREMGAYDLHPRPEYPVRSETADFGREHTAAVSAHVNAKKVMSFYRGFLSRSGIDDNNMDVKSMVRCTANDGYAPEWKQAVWFDNHMWYGQWRDADGAIHSYSRHLDVIAHELTHGVTQFSAGLKYYEQPGALDESFADIFALAIWNVNRLGESAPASAWTWEIGVGLGTDGGPLRDLSKPEPAHMKDFAAGSGDDSGVHALGGIHSKAVHSIFTALDDQGGPLFRWQDAVFLYYICLCRLPESASFGKARELLTDAAKTYYSGRPAADQAILLAAIGKAYDDVGIA